jgi:hypothetical protein
MVNERTGDDVEIDSPRHWDLTSDSLWGEADRLDLIKLYDFDHGDVREGPPDRCAIPRCAARKLTGDFDSAARHRSPPRRGCGPFRDNSVHRSEMISPTRMSPGVRVPLLADSDPSFGCPKEGSDASREDRHARRARSSSLEVRGWRTDP